MATNDNIDRIVREMSSASNARDVIERAKAETTARKERISEQAEAAQLVAKETLDERDRRDQQWCDTHMGNMTPHQYRTYVRERHGFDPGV
jgi:hypothetical protein